MKKILLISAAVLLLAACHKEPYPQDSDNEYLVYTSPGKNVNFPEYQTFDIADSLLVIGQSDISQLVHRIGSVGNDFPDKIQRFSFVDIFSHKKILSDNYRNYIGKTPQNQVFFTCEYFV